MASDMIEKKMTWSTQKNALTASPLFSTSTPFIGYITFATPPTPTPLSTPPSNDSSGGDAEAATSTVTGPTTGAARTDVAACAAKFVPTAGTVPIAGAADAAGAPTGVGDFGLCPD